MDSLLYAQMTREPVPGQVKTRLLSALSPAEAAALHRSMTEHCCRVLCSTGAVVQLWVDGNADAFAACASLGATVRRQPAGDLGQRMAFIVETGLRECAAVVLAGSDCPFIDGDYLRAAVAALKDNDAVLGPALDGGYVLLGLNRFSEDLFKGIEWGGAGVLRDTLKALDGLGWRYALLEPLRDIDRPEDLPHLPAALTQ